MAMKLGLLMVLAQLVACDGGNPPSPREVSVLMDGGRGVDAGVAPNRADASQSVERDGGVGVRWTMVGSYRCCLPGEGKTCCAGVHLCYEYGGYRGDCVGPGGGFDGKDSCALCCPGLTRASIDCVDSPGFAISGFVCISCGDGVCGAAENACNCPSDCSDGHKDEDAGSESQKSR